jgi:flagellar protein FliS
MARRDIRARRDAISKSLAIISELQSTLNMEQGGDIAAQLDRLYTWMTDALIDATIKQDPTPLQDVRRVLETLREAWQQIAATKPVQPESAA